MHVFYSVSFVRTEGLEGSAVPESRSQAAFLLTPSHFSCVVCLPHADTLVTNKGFYAFLKSTLEGMLIGYVPPPEIELTT